MKILEKNETHTLLVDHEQKPVGYTVSSSPYGACHSPNAAYHGASRLKPWESGPAIPTEMLHPGVLEADASSGLGRMFEVFTPMTVTNPQTRLQTQCLCESYRNFPNEDERGEDLLREAYATQMERLGVLVEDGGLVVDLGCGSGTSTR